MCSLGWTTSFLSKSVSIYELFRAPVWRSSVIQWSQIKRIYMSTVKYDKVISLCFLSWEPSGSYIGYTTLLYIKRVAEPLSKTLRKAEPIRNVQQHKTGSNIPKHAWDNYHAIDFESVKVIDNGNFRSRLTLESWHAAKDRKKCW